MPHDRQSGSAEERLHDILVHARGRAQHARAYVWNVRQLEQSLDGPVLAEGPMQHRKDDVHVDGAVGNTASQCRLGLKRGQRIDLPLRLRGDDDRLAPSQHGRARRSFRVAGPQIEPGARFANSLPCNKRSASEAVNQRPSLVMPMGTTSYLVLSMALKTEAAESNDTSCSPLRPPKRMPTRSFFMVMIWA